MSILDFARMDHAFLMGSGEVGQTETVTLKAPSGQTATLQGLFTDIGAGLDPSTGLTVTVDTASIIFSEAELVRAGLGIPAAVQDRKSKPWLVIVRRIDGTNVTYKLDEPRRDRRMGSHWFVLTHYKD